jgi:hypothetical protein
MKILVNFANDIYIESQKLSSNTGMSVGGFDRVISYSPDSISKRFKQKNRDIFSLKRGYGYWLWKPYIILDALRKSKKGDWIFYSDSAVEFIDTVDLIIDAVESKNQSVFPFEIKGAKEVQWTKRSVLEAFDLWGDDGSYTSQRSGAFILLKNSDEAVKFFTEYLDYCEKKNLLDDSLDLKNEHSMLIEHRHDQSIFSCLTKKYDLDVFRDPSQWGIKYKSFFENSEYPQILNHTRKSNKTFIENYAFKIKIHLIRKLVSLRLRVLNKYLF